MASLSLSSRDLAQPFLLVPTGLKVSVAPWEPLHDIIHVTLHGLRFLTSHHRAECDQVSLVPMTSLTAAFCPRKQAFTDITEDLGCSGPQNASIGD